MNRTRLPLFAVLTLLIAATLFAADVSGKWTASFDTQIGVQNYVYTFAVAGEKLTGNFKSDNSEGEIAEGSIKRDEVSFVENLKFQDMTIRVEYKGKLAGDEIKFVRKVGDFATEELVAKRAK